MIKTVSCPLFLHSYGRQGCDWLKIAKLRLTFSSFTAMPATEIIKKNDYCSLMKLSQNSNMLVT